jgi:hypothetical protein
VVCGVIVPGLGIGIWSWKTGEGIAIGAGGAILTMILAAAVAVMAAADGITVAGAALVQHRVTVRRGLRSSRRARR